VLCASKEICGTDEKDRKSAKSALKNTATGLLD
jgi:hypothetical protein